MMRVILKIIELFMVSSDQINKLIVKINKALDNNPDLTRCEFQIIAGKIYTEIMKSCKEEKEIKEKQKREPTRWNSYVKVQILLMKEEDKDKPSNERRNSRDMFKLASEKWKNGDNHTYVV